MIAITTFGFLNDIAQIENQQQAVASWLQAGFQVLACNTEEEVKKLSPLFPEVEFVIPPRTALERFGKPYIYVSDILQLLKGRGVGPCLLINSDIRLYDFSGEMLSEIEREARDTLLYLHRYDTMEGCDREGTYYFSGIDGFFLNAQKAGFFPDEGYAVGRPEWDHWMIYRALMAGMPVAEIKNPVAFHVLHPQRWTPSQSSAIVLDTKREAQEAYYCDTNRAMSDLDGVRYFPVREMDERDTVQIEYEKNPPAGAMTQSWPFIREGKGRYRLQTLPGLYYDRDCVRLLLERLRVKGYPAIRGSVGLGYMDGGKFRRVCALHGPLKEHYQDGCILLRDDARVSDAADCGVLTAYLDFKASGIPEELGKFFLYPSGRGARLMLECLRANGLTPAGLLDKDPQLHGTMCGGYRIGGSDILRTASFDKVLIASNLYGLEIARELGRFVPAEKLLVI